MSGCELCVELSTKGLLSIDIDIELGACQPDDGVEVKVIAYTGERFTGGHSFTIISGGPHVLASKDIRLIVAAIFNQGRGLDPPLEKEQSR
jgi:hypothetical protein